MIQFKKSKYPNLYFLLTVGRSKDKSYYTLCECISQILLGFCISVIAAVVISIFIIILIELPLTFSIIGLHKGWIFSLPTVLLSGLLWGYMILWAVIILFIYFMLFIENLIIKIYSGYFINIYEKVSGNIKKFSDNICVNIKVINDE